MIEAGNSNVQIFGDTFIKF